MSELLTAAREHPLFAHRETMLYVAFSLMAAEIVVLSLGYRARYQTGLMLSTSAMWIVEQGGRFVMYPLRLLVFLAMAELAPSWLSVGFSRALLGPGATLALAYLCVDFLYYWKHRLLHRLDLGWALHAVHHSSDDFNLMAALRLGWVQRYLDDFFYLPLCLLGLPPVVVLLAVELNHASQFWCHTRCIGRLGLLDRLINTPSNHRVHHAHTRALADHNYGSTLMCWDRWFGTYAAEPEGGVPTFGVEQGPVGLNPLRIQLTPLFLYLRGLRTSQVDAHS
ncbi:MAG: sterol desaturase family protein [Myxococcales bacterium]|nr:sterol desaturase family protein [Myxococcales bacterium]